MANNKETEIQRRIMLAASQNEAVTFRNNTGNAVAGSHMRRIDKDSTQLLRAGDWVVSHGSRIQYGLCVGSSDLIGWRTVTVTPEMVGSKLAVFTALEVKTEKGKATEDQERFLSAVQSAGGLAGVVRSTDDAVKVLGVHHE